VKRLSRYRRHKAVGPSLLIFALLAIGTTFSVASATTTAQTTKADRSALIEEGRQIFLKGCWRWRCICGFPSRNWSYANGRHEPASNA
jgi:hypothetical protein